MNLTDTVAGTVFVMGVVAATVVPRLPNDESWWSIGGNISHPFRRMVVILALLHAFRVFCLPSQGLESDSLVYVLLKVTESFWLCFICLLTPYLLQLRLVNLINIGGRPGQNIMPWLYANMVLQFLGMALSSYFHSDSFWGIKKLGDALSGPPVIRTVKLYSSITTVNTNAGSNGRGRGFVMAQMILALEYWNLAVTLLSAMAYFLDQKSHTTIENTNQFDSMEEVFAGLRTSGSYSTWTRVLAHGMLLNSIDEAQHFAPDKSYREKNTDDNDVGPTDPANDNLGVALVSRRV
jgi:hypothetical protein